MVGIGNRRNVVIPKYCTINNKDETIISVIKRLLVNTSLQGWLEYRAENYYLDV